MKEQGYISTYPIIDRALATMQTEDIPFSDIIRSISDVLSYLIGYETSERVSAIITIKNHRGFLPKDIYLVDGIKNTKSNTPLYEVSDIYHSTTENAVKTNRYDTDVDTFSFNGNYIFTSFKDGEIEIVYKRMFLDEKGFPLIPNDISFINAVKYHIMFTIAEGLYMVEKISERKLNYLDTQRSWYIGQVESKIKIPSHSKMESIANNLSRLIQDNYSYEKGFSTLNKAQRFKNQP